MYKKYVWKNDNYSNSMIFLGLGTNMGNRLSNLEEACTLISSRVGTLVEKSPVYETAAWGDVNQNDFYNLVVSLESNLLPLTLLNCVLAIENEMGRIRVEKWGARIIDIDILLYRDEIIDLPELTIPHPLLSVRRFVLQPFADIAPDLIEPVSKKSIAALLQQCSDTSYVKKILD